ncbi:hypothetical protein N5923_08805 [Erwiniaceae bacterium BAC15a-03b]|uniref:Uncharacterized protein n=1 Tax=Winslowiella arboricola TaxID=2978220 RepID=A0A9J6PLF3_9GAMM|nr:hypothetical protein [Winslowiella arboricola]MCU5771739.1 hypothetical protein [Winslowiella arboricola]MCU5777590.1 hypothetical protein [Winslowiella arboricola]
MYNNVTAKKLLHEFERLKLILIKYNENNWVRGVELVIEKLEWSFSEKCNEPYAFYLDACNTWKAMDRVNGSFSDYYIWHDDFNERVRLNELLDSIKNHIWDIVIKI